MLSNEDMEYNKIFFGEDDTTLKNAEEKNDEANNASEHNKEKVIVNQTEEAEKTEKEQNEKIEEETKEEQKKETKEEQNEKPEEKAKKGETEDEELVTLIWNGKEVKVTKEEQRKLAQQGFDYTFKTQTLAKYKKQFEAMEEAGINEKDIELIKMIKNGNKEAMAYLLQETKTDPLDLVNFENPKITFKNEQKDIIISDEVKPLIEQVSKNSQLLEKMQQVEAILPDAVIKAMGQNADLFYGVVSEVQSGEFYNVMPQVQKHLATMDELGRSYVLQNPDKFASLYINIKNAMAQQMQKQVQMPSVNVVKEKPNMAEVGIKKSTTARRQEEVIKDAFNSDEEYQRILNRLKNR